MRISHFGPFNLFYLSNSVDFRRSRPLDFYWLILNWAFLLSFFNKMHTVDIDSDDDDDHEDSISVCANCKHRPTRREDLILCSLCRITQYCSVSCQRKDSDFHRFSCGLVAKGSSAKEF